MVPTLVQEEGQLGILSVMMHSSAVPDQEPQGEQVRQAKASRFGRMAGQEANYVSKTSANDTEEEMEVVVEETADHKDVSLWTWRHTGARMTDRQSR